MCATYEFSVSDLKLLVHAITVMAQVRRPGSIYPGYVAPIVLSTPGLKDLRVTEAIWGWRPHWKKSGYVQNTRSESIDDDGSMWKRAFHEQRCLIPGTAWLEFGPNPGQPRKQLWRISEGGGGGVFCFAGIWRPSRLPRPPGMSPDIELLEYSMLMRDPSDELAHIHDRMPVILQPDDYGAWLDTGSGAEAEILKRPRTEGWQAQKIERKDILKPAKPGE